MVKNLDELNPRNPPASCHIRNENQTHVLLGYEFVPYQLDQPLLVS